MVFQQHMALEQKEQKRIDDAKEKEKRDAEELLYKAFSQMHSSSSSSRQTEKSGQKSIEISQELNVINAQCFEDLVECDDLLPRPIIRVAFRHTPRIFKTPSRESTAKRELEFILKNRTSLKGNALLNAGTSICDVDPMWSKTKGDEFMNKGDYCSAINAYSDTLDADGTIVDALGSRASCYLQLRQGNQCIKDCLDALVMKDAIESCFHGVEEQRQFEQEMYLRLGMAYCLNKEYTKGMKSFEEARKIKGSREPGNIIDQCIDYLTLLMKANDWKDEADRLFAEGKLSDAMYSYTKAIDVDPLFINPLINRTACHLAMRNSTGCIKDSMNALQVLSQSKQRFGSPVLASLLGPSLHTKRKWIVTLLCRLSSARRLENDLVGSLKDLEDALKNARRINDMNADAIEKDIVILKEELATLKSKS
jgi:dyslexia susceptibility 1 candidate gene 1 protein